MPRGRKLTALNKQCFSAGRGVLKTLYKMFVQKPLVPQHLTILRMPNKYMLLARVAICSFMITFTLEWNIICNKAHLDCTAHGYTPICSQSFVGRVVGSRPIERKKKCID